jgi:predicted dehydrogenase
MSTASRPDGQLRIGTLGTAHITPVALIRPARLVPEIHVVAVAARDEGRARSFAGRFGIPNTLHAAWTVRALEAA